FAEPGRVRAWVVSRGLSSRWRSLVAQHLIGFGSESVLQRYSGPGTAEHGSQIAIHQGIDPRPGRGDRKRCGTRRSLDENVQVLDIPMGCGEPARPYRGLPGRYEQPGLGHHGLAGRTGRELQE